MKTLKAKNISIKETKISSNVTHQVIRINGIPVNRDSRNSIFYNTHSRTLWYSINGVTVGRYVPAKNSIYRVTVSGTKYTIDFSLVGGLKIIEDDEQRPNDLDLAHFELYKLRNGFKVKLIQLVNDPRFSTTAQWIGIYSSPKNKNELATIRFDLEGRVLSHDRVKEYDIVGEYTATTFIVLFKNGVQVEIKNFDTLEKAEKFKSTLAGNEFIRIEEIKE
jgi:hypothetical protein